jgi:starvation-inducible DNA-binding protein
MEELEQKLLEVFADNFVSYWSAHSNHINITGRNFYSDHKLLQKIYEDAQDQIDALGEFIRTIESKVPATIPDILELSTIGEATAEDADDRLRIVGENQEYMMERYKELFDIATVMTDQDIANFAADRIRAHARFKWMIESTIDE